MRNKPENNKADQEQMSAVHDSPKGGELCLAVHTAEKEGGFYLPYLRPGMTLLDCGCGPGTITVGLAKAVDPGQVTGVDIQERNIKKGEERAVEANIENLRFEVGNICQLDFPDNRFDALFSHDVLHHIPEMNKVLREMYRVMKPGGIIGIREFDIGGLLLAPESELLEKSLALFGEVLDHRGAHPRMGRHLARLLHETGFVNVEISASYDVYSGPEGRKLFAHIAAIITGPDFVEKATRYELANVDELKAMVDAWQDWAEIPGAFHARSHCEAIGRKA